MESSTSDLVRSFYKAVTGAEPDADLLAHMAADDIIARAAEYKIFTEKFDRTVSGVDYFQERHEGEIAERPHWFYTQGKPKQSDSASNMAVSLLVDQSGSNRNVWQNDIRIAAYLARRLEAQGAKTEVLTATTRSFRGGTSREEWIRFGKPQPVGRLTDGVFIAHKAADEPFGDLPGRLHAVTLAGMKDDLTGELILWAHKRLMALPQKEKAIVLLGDHYPVEDSTASVNGDTYMLSHARGVMRAVQHFGQVAIMGVKTPDAKRPDVLNLVDYCDWEELYAVDHSNPLIPAPEIAASIARQLPDFIKPWKP